MITRTLDGDAELVAVGAELVSGGAELAGLLAAADEATDAGRAASVHVFVS